MERYRIGKASSSEEWVQWQRWATSRRRLLQLGGVAAAALATGSGAGVLANSAFAESSMPVSGGHVRISQGYGGVETFDPVTAFDGASVFSMLLTYEQLVRIAADGVSLESGLAESWTISDDQLVYTFTLREANFHDGSPCTASDVVFSFGRIMTDPASIWGSLFTAIDTVEAPDPHTAIVRLRMPWVPLLADLALFAASILPKSVFEAKQGALFTDPIGTGPFMVVSWAQHEDVVLERNPSYWDAGAPLLDGATLTWNPDARARLDQVRAGTVDIALDVPFDEMTALRSDSSVVVLENPTLREDFLLMNTSRPPFNDLMLRQAVAHAVDKEAIVERVLFMSGEVASSYLPLLPMHDSAATAFPHDIDRARELLASSNSPDGFDAEIVLPGGYDEWTIIAEMIAADLSQIGGRISVTSAPDHWYDRVNTGDYDLSITFWTNDILDPSEATTYMIVGTEPGHAMYTFWNNDEVNQLAAAAPAMADMAQQRDAYARIQAIVNEEVPLVPLYYSNARVVTSMHVRDFSVLPTGSFRLWETWRDDA